MAQVTDFSALDAAINSTSDLETAIAAIETTAAGDRQEGQNFGHLYLRLRTLAERLAVLRLHPSGARPQKLVERY